MMPVWITAAVSLFVLFITLGTGANAALKTPGNSSAIAMKFAFFMAISYFFFYYIGAWITKYLIDIMPSGMWKLTSAILFFAMAVKTIWNAFSYKAEDNAYNLSKTVIQLLLCIASGFNALLIGIALTLSYALILQTALMITLGAFAGSMFGAKLSVDAAKIATKLRPAIFGSVIMLAIAAYLFIKQ